MTGEIVIALLSAALLIVLVKYRVRVRRAGIRVHLHHVVKRQWEKEAAHVVKFDDAQRLTAMTQRLERVLAQAKLKIPTDARTQISAAWSSKVKAHR